MGKRYLGICIDCGENKLIQAKERCANCYIKYRRETEKKHPCVNCGAFVVILKKGLCSTCYKRDWNEINRDHVNEYNRKWSSEHVERNRANKRRYDNSPRGKIVNKLNLHKRIQRLRDAPGDGMSPEQWEQIKQNQDHRCYYCGRKMRRFHIEHKTPLSRGGRHETENIVASCKRCNLKKGTMTDVEFLDRIEKEGLD